MAKSSLQKSHSVVSNFKLTLICLMLSLSISMVWVGAFLIVSQIVELVVGIVITAACTVLALISFILISKFTR
ncbi:MAG: hypothetical protein K6F14_04650 [Clostridiales bacterium]|nr:hypothetical protein [Clostridiales bacterium]